MLHAESVKKLGRRNLQSLKRWRCDADAGLVPLLDTAGRGALRAAMQRARCELRQKRRTVRFTRLRSALLLHGVQGSIHVCALRCFCFWREFKAPPMCTAILVLWCC